MSVASEITRLYSVRGDIFDAIEAKGVQVPSGSQLDDCPTLIGQISGGTPPAPVLPDYTLRLKFIEGVTPVFAKGTATQVSASPNIWDLTYQPVSGGWSDLLADQNALLEVIAAGNAPNIYNFQGMFTNCRALTSVCLFDTSSATGNQMLRMFSNCSALTTVPLFDTSGLTNLGYMFYYCSSLYSVPLFNTSSVTNFERAFSNCTNLTVLPLLNTSNATNFEYTFYGCESLKTLPNLDTSKVSNFRYTFQGCTSLENISAINTSSATNMYRICYGCTSLRTIPLLNTDNVNDISYAFTGCTNVESGALALYNQASSQTTPPTTYSRCFRNCGENTTTGAAELAQIPSGWK